MCWPFNTYIQPGDNYSLIVQSEDVVQQALTWDLNNDTLELSTTADFASGYPIEVVVWFRHILGFFILYWTLEEFTIFVKQRCVACFRTPGNAEGRSTCQC